MTVRLRTRRRKTVIFRSRGRLWLWSKRRALGAAFSPLQILGLVQWTDAADLATLFSDDAGTIPAVDAGTVKFIADKSTAGNNVVQTNVAFAPLLQFNTQNGLPTLLFDGTDDIMLSQSTLTAQTVFFAGERLGSNTDSTAFTFTGTTGRAISANGALDDLFVGATSWQGDGGTVEMNGGALEPLSQPNVYSLYSHTIAGESVGIGARAGGSLFGNWRIYETIVYDTALSATDRGRVEAYLTKKWIDIRTYSYSYSDSYS